jgi:hypothetical protein
MQSTTQMIKNAGEAQIALGAYFVADDRQGGVRELKLIFQNQSNGGLMFTLDGSTASATNGFFVAANSLYEREGACIETNPISVWGANANQQFHVARGSVVRTKSL